MEVILINHDKLKKMGTTNQIIDLLPREELKKRVCCSCSQPITDKDNLAFYYRTNNDTDWTNFKEGTSRGWISIEIELEHRDCPEIKNYDL